MTRKHVTSCISKTTSPRLPNSFLSFSSSNNSSAAKFSLRACDSTGLSASGGEVSFWDAVISSLGCSALHDGSDSVTLPVAALVIHTDRYNDPAGTEVACIGNTSCIPADDRYSPAGFKYSRLSLASHCHACSAAPGADANSGKHLAFSNSTVADIHVS